jgi:Flp pilus assembly protein CpaB
MQNKTIISVAAGALVGGALAYLYMKNQKAKKAQAVKAKQKDS